MRGGEMMINNQETKSVRPENRQARINAEIIIEALKNEKLEEKAFIDENKKGYTKADIQRDKWRVLAREADFKGDQDHLSDLDIEKIETGKQRATALEKICINLAGKRDSDGSSRYGWYGKNAYTSETTKTDDIFGGVDGFLEFDMGGGQSHKIALAIDASMKADFSSIRRKMKRGAEKIAEGKMEVKYFKSAVSDYKGKLKNIIPVVLGLEGDKANEVIKLFAEIVTLESKQSRSANEDMDLAYKIREAQQHPCQVVFLKEMKVQLEMYQKIFTRKGSFIENDLKELLKIIGSLLADKNDIDMGNLESDGVFEEIRKVAVELPTLRNEIMGFNKK